MNCEYKLACCMQVQDIGNQLLYYSMSEPIMPFSFSESCGGLLLRFCVELSSE